MASNTNRLKNQNLTTSARNLITGHVWRFCKKECSYQMLNLSGTLIHSVIPPLPPPKNV